MSKYRVTVDTGGTFSDFVFFNEDTGEITITKVPSTPKEPFQAVLNGVKELIDQGVPAGDVSFFCHGTTVGTNALLEEKGAKTGLLVTQGFRGIYEVMEQTRGYGPATYDLFFEKPRLLAPPYFTEEIPERVDFRGNVLKPIDVETSSRGRAQAQEKRRAIGGRLLSFFVLESGARAQDQGNFRAGISRSAAFAFLRSLAADPRVLPAEHDGDQRLYPARHGKLLEAVSKTACERWASPRRSSTSCNPTAACRRSKAPAKSPLRQFSPAQPAGSSRPWAPASASASTTSSPSTWAARVAMSR